MSGSWVVLIVQLVVQPVATQPAPLTQPAPQPAPVAQPQPVPPPVYGPQYAQPQPYGPPPQNYGPPDIDALDHQYGAYYPEPKGKGLRLAGGITLGTSAPLLFAALVCLITGAGLSDSGEKEAARVLLYTAAGMGLWGVLGTGGGAGMLVAGNARRRKYHGWLLQQHGQVAPPRIGWRPGAFVGPQRAGLALTLRF